MDSQRFGQLARRLNNRIPLVGRLIRWSACKQLAVDASATAVPYLVDALGNADTRIDVIADTALRSLKHQEAIDVLCRIWHDSRTPSGVAPKERLGQLIRECNYVASKPDYLRVETALQVGKPEIAAECGPNVDIITRTLFGSFQDPKRKQCAERSLRSLRAQDAIDALCATWAQHRSGDLGKFIMECRYLAQSPVAVRVLSALMAGRENELSKTDEELRTLLLTLDDRDRDLAAKAGSSLRAIAEVSAHNSLCRMAICDPSGPAARICIEQGWRPSDPEDMCLYLCVTRQFDAYFTEDFEFQNLRLAYECADAQVRAQVMAVVRSGDRRWQGFFGVRKPVSQCTAEEITLVIDSGLRHQNWPALWNLFQQVSFKYTWRILGPLLDSGWKPENADDLKTFEAVLDAATGGAAPRRTVVDNDPYSMAAMLNEGRSGDLSRRSEAELIAALEVASPPDAIPIVGAIGSKYKGDSAAARAVMTSPHWMVRLAGSLVGLGHYDASDLGVTAAVSVNVDALQSFWPLCATPEDLENLRTWPTNALSGEAAVMYAVLETLLLERLSMGTFTEYAVEISEDAGEFEEIQ